eukprot:362231-Chlamydomonas_euryale.AAC.12
MLPVIASVQARVRRWRAWLIAQVGFGVRARRVLARRPSKDANLFATWPAQYKPEQMEEFYRDQAPEEEAVDEELLSSARQRMRARAQRRAQAEAAASEAATRAAGADVAVAAAAEVPDVAGTAGAVDEVALLLHAPEQPVSGSEDDEGGAGWPGGGADGD